MSYSKIVSVTSVSVGTNYVWLVVLPTNRQCLVVDPTAYEPVHLALQRAQLQPVAILVTHHHRDHVGGIEALCNEYGKLAVYAPASEQIEHTTHPVQHDDLLSWQGFCVRVIDIPGHTSGHVAYVGNGMLLAGDTLFAAGCGRVFEGTYEQMYSSLCTLANLPDNTLLYCAHEYTYDNLQFAQLVQPDNLHVAKRLQHVKNLRAKGLPTLPCPLFLELLTNPFLRCHLPQLQQRAELRCGKTLRRPSEVFAVLRQWKDSYISQSLAISPVTDPSAAA